MVKFNEEKLMQIARYNYERTYDEIKSICNIEELFQKEIDECEDFINTTFKAEDLIPYSMEKGAIDTYFKRLHNYKTNDYKDVVSDIQNIVVCLPDEILIPQVFDLRCMAEALAYSLVAVILHMDTLAEYCRNLFTDDFAKHESVFEIEPKEHYYSHDFLEMIISIGEAFPSLQPEP